MKKILIYLMIVFALSSFILASVPQESKNLLYYYPTNSSTTVIDESTLTTQYNGTAFNGVVFTNTSNTSAMSFDGANDYVDTGLLLSKNKPFTLSYWIFFNSTGSGFDFFTSSNDGTSANSGFSAYFDHTTSKITSIVTDGLGTNIISITANSTTSKDAWHHYVFTGTGDTSTNGYKVYIDNVLEGQAGATGFMIDSIIYNVILGHYTNAPAVDGLKGGLSNVLIYNYTLNSSEVQEIYNLGRSYYYNNESPMDATNITLSPDILNFQDNLTCSANITDAFSAIFNWEVNNVSVKTETEYMGTCYQETATTSTLCGGLATGSYSTVSLFNPTNAYDGNDGTFSSRTASSGFLYTNYTIPNGTVSVNWSIKSNESYSNYSILNDCLDGDTLILRIELRQGIPSDIALYECYNYNTLSFDIISTESANLLYEEKVYFYYGDSLVNSTLEYTNFNLTDEVSCIINYTDGVTNETTDINKTIGQQIIFSASEYFTSNTISNFTIEYDEGSFLANGSTINIYNWNLTDEYTFTHPDYATSRINLTTNISTQSYEFSVFDTNTIFMTFRDKNNLSIITENISIEVIGSTITYTNNTVTGNLTFSLLNPESYTIRYSASGYSTNFYYLTLTNKTFENITLYMSLNTSTTSVEATVYDEKTLYVEDARIKVFVEDPSNPSDYILSQMCDTNFEGKCLLDLSLNEKNYRFVIEYPFGEVKKITNPSYIFDNELTFQIIIGDIAAEDYVATKKVYGNIVFDETLNQFTYTYNDPNNEITQGCMDIYKINPTGKNLYSSSCESTVSGLITLTITPENGTSYLAQGSVYYNSEQVPIIEDYKSYRSEDSGFALNGALMIIFIIMTFASIAMWNPVVLIILLPLPLTLGSFMGFINIDWQWLLGIHFVFLLIGWSISKRG